MLHTLRHTPGHLSLYNPSSKSLYLGDIGYWPTPLHPHPVGRAGDQYESITKCLKREMRYLFPGHGLPRCSRDIVTEFLRDLRLRQQQLEHRLLVLLSRYGPLTVPDLFAETFSIKLREDYAIDGWYGNGLNCVHAHLHRLFNAGSLQRVTRDNIFAWDVTDSGRLPDRDIDVERGYDRLTTLTTLDANENTQ